MIHHRRSFWILLAVLLLAGCANQVAPTGGPRDVTPPRVVEAQPANHSVGFEGRRIEITFDEFVTLNNANQQVLFSPPLADKPDIKLSGKTVVIKLKEDLRPNTTYTIDFGEAVKDFHEGNQFKDYLYTFATGATLDSLSLSGVVLDAETRNPLENLLVGLYADTLTFRAPDYLARTDKSGRFTVYGLPDAPFWVVALEDMNANRYYDQPNEKVGFIDTLVRPTDSVSLTLSAFIEEDTTQMLLEGKLVEEGLLRFVFRRPADGVDFHADLPAEAPADSLAFQWVPVWSPNRDTLCCWFTPNRIDSLRVAVRYDTLININNSYSLQFRETRSRGRDNPKVLKVNDNLKSALLMPDEDLLLCFPEPVARVNGELPFEQADDQGLVYRYLEPVVDTAECVLEIPDSVFFSVRGRTNNAVTLRFRRAKEADLGNIYITVVPPEGMQVVVQLTDNRGKVLAEQAVDSLAKVGFTALVPAKYKLQALIDADRNGRWSTGNYHRRFLPEAIVPYKDELELRAGWDIDLDEVWNLR